MRRRAATRGATLLLTLLALSWAPRAAALQDTRLAASEKGGGIRAERGGGSIFDAPDGDDPAAETDPEWASKTAAIAADMRAHLGRARKRMQADLIGSDRNILVKAVLGVVDFFRSAYFRNVRRSLTVCICAWAWYVFNTKTYTPPEYDD
mmetsp:Transcript_23319/g.59537  ORF Transcript_23319/g.59537 Transcript_23319/m.59537 type:complete len:150 (-) Transcript_23319:110-559(-)